MASRDNPRVLFPPPLIFAGFLALGLFLDSKPFASGAIQIIGIAFALGGLAIIATALGLFRSSKTRPEPWQPASALVSRGIYRVTRNPMYLGMALLSLGVAVAFMSLAGIIMTMIAAAIIDRAVISREEAYLTRRFGEDYMTYRRRVRRWL